MFLNFWGAADYPCTYVCAIKREKISPLLGSEFHKLSINKILIQTHQVDRLSAWNVGASVLYLK